MAAFWRLSPPPFAHSLDGEGNRRVGARWNSPGRGVVYTSANLSLCVLETYVHFTPIQRDRIPDFEAVCLSVPDGAATFVISKEQFDKLLQGTAPEAAFRAIGDDWLASGEHLLLQAPSVIVPEESNILINPLHSGMREVRIVSTRRFRFDPRLSRQR